MSRIRVKVAACAACCGALLAPAVARAHVSLHPNTIPVGAFVTLNVRVPGEQEGAYTYKVDMLVPPGLPEVATENVPGWSVTETMRKLAKPIQTDDGPISEEVARIIWTGDRSKLGRIEDGQFIQFPLSIAMPTSIAGQSLAFKTVQFYSNGKVVRWIGPPSAEYPAPTINATAQGGAIEEVAGGEAGPAPGKTPAGQAGASAPARAADNAGGASKGLAIAALIVGALGLLAGLGALASARRRRNVGGT
jgi:periplasmic copper chaperone A